MDNVRRQGWKVADRWVKHEPLTRGVEFRAVRDLIHRQETGAPGTNRGRIGALLTGGDITDRVKVASLNVLPFLTTSMVWQEVKFEPRGVCIIGVLDEFPGDGATARVTGNLRADDVKSASAISVHAPRCDCDHEGILC